jgi:signal transduction histidine kinase
VERSLRSRILLLNLLSAGAALLLAVLGLSFYEYFESRRSLQEKLVGLAAVVADNSAAALAFRDPAAAAEVLAALKSVPSVKAAGLFLADGARFAVYPETLPELRAVVSPLPHPSVEFHVDHVEVRQPVVLQKITVGELVLISGLGELYARLMWYSLITMLTVLVALGASTLLLTAQRRRLNAAQEALMELTRTLERRVSERTEELNTAMSELEAFTYSVSHDLRSPLGAISNFAGLLRMTEAGRLTEAGKTALGFVESNASRTAELVEGLLEFSRLGRRGVAHAAVPMDALVSEVLADLKAEQLAVVRRDPLPDCRGDSLLLKQVWTNLIGNALKYSRGRSPARIEIGFEGPAAAYFVRDNGVGFSMEHTGKLFGVFERLHNDPQFEGTGLGLALVERIVRRHGGRIWAEAEPERGATFRFTVPGAPPDPERPALR